MTSRQDMDILSVLAGGDRRSIGRVGAVVPFVLAHPEQLPVLLDGMEGEDEVLRMRCADAAEKISISRPDWFVPLRSRLLRLARTSVQQELRWHIAQMLPRIGLDASQRDVAITILLEYLRDRSRIVTTSSMTSLFEFAREDPPLQRKLGPILERFLAHGSAAERSRAGRLLRELGSSAGRGEVRSESARRNR